LGSPVGPLRGPIGIDGIEELHHGIRAQRAPGGYKPIGTRRCCCALGERRRHGLESFSLTLDEQSSIRAASLEQEQLDQEGRSHVTDVTDWSHEPLPDLLRARRGGLEDDAVRALSFCEADGLQEAEILEPGDRPIDERS
jgi:hypothetical protein